MATRFYLPSTNVNVPLPILAVDSQWEQTTGLMRSTCSNIKLGTPLSNSPRTWASATTQQWCWFQYQSPPLAEAYSWTTADTVSMVIRGFEADLACDDHLAYSIRVVSNNGGAVRGTIGFFGATSTELVLTTPTTRIHSARVNGATNFSSQVGDRIIIEIGLHGVTPSTAFSQTLRVGDPSATADFALTAGLTTDLCPWVELSRTVSFNQQVKVPQIKVA